MRLLLILILGAFISCNFVAKTIQLESYALIYTTKKIVPLETVSPEGVTLQYVDTISESEMRGLVSFHKKGIKITIDTIDSLIHIPLDLDEIYFAGSGIEKQTMPFINNSNEVNLSISSWKIVPEKLILQTKYNEMDFNCTKFDSAFVIKTKNGDEYFFIGTKLAKDNTLKSFFE